MADVHPDDGPLVAPPTLLTTAASQRNTPVFPAATWLNVITTSSGNCLDVDCDILHIADVIDSQVERSHEVPLANSLAVNLTPGDESFGPYPVPKTKTKIEPDAGPLPVESEMEGDAINEL